MNANDKLVKARAGLILDMPFFGALALRLTLVENAGIPTAATDGRQLAYNPAFIDKLSLAEVKGVLAHEVMHCANQHHLRRDARDAKRWNQACDHAINAILEKSGVTLPAGRLNDPVFAGMSAEAIYPRIPEASGGGSSDPGGCGEIMDASGDDGKPLGEAETARQAAEWKIATAQAAQAARSMGALPGELDRLVKEIVEAKVDWRETLRRFVQQAAKGDYSWSQPNRRHVHAGVFLPSLRSQTIGEIVVAVDTSGSIDGDTLKQFAGEVNSILEEYDTTCAVVYCDSRVHRVDEYTRNDLPLSLNTVGGGGTDFRPAFAAADGRQTPPACMVYLTDMEGTFPAAEPGYPVLWVITSRIDSAPFGEVVKI